MKRMEGRTALVSAGADGLGAAIAARLAQEGAKVTVLDRSAEAIDAAQGQPAMAGIRFEQVDLSDASQTVALLERLVSDTGGFDILVNNAGGSLHTPARFLDESDEDWDRVLTLNLTAAVRLTRAVLPAMMARGWGRIVNVASAHGLVASPYKSAYVMAKHAVVGLTKTVALEGAEHGVTANAICPGYVLTPLVERQIPETAKARGITEEEVIRDVLLAAQPTRRFVQPQQIGALTVFLCSAAASEITGTAIPVDGGWTAH